MAKTPVQEKLEAQRGQDIREIVVEALETCRETGQRLEVTWGGLGVSKGTFYQWCRELDIEPRDYRRQTV